MKIKILPISSECWYKIYNTADLVIISGKSKIGKQNRKVCKDGIDDIGFYPKSKEGFIMSTISKHAYLIIAHNEFGLLQKLISVLDDERNDIFIHIDKKSTFHQEDFFASKSKLTIVSKNRVQWGDITQTETELLLFRLATQQNRYAYYHLISGVDLPLKSQNYIHEFFDNYQGTEFLDVGFCEHNEKCISHRTEYYHFVTGRTKIRRILRKFILAVEQICKIHRRYDIKMYMGCNWCSVTDDFVRYLVSQTESILSLFKYTLCADELYKQTILMNSDFKNKRYVGYDKISSSLREIDWNRGSPYTWRDEDYTYLYNSSNLFARKFSSQYEGIIDKILDYVGISMSNK